MKTIASLMVRAKTLKRFGSPAVVEKQMAQIIAHPDFENLCNLLETLSNFSFAKGVEVKEEVKSPIEHQEELTKQDILDLNLDINLDDDVEDGTSDEILIVDDSDSDADFVDDGIDDSEDFEIVIDEEPTTEVKKEKVEASLVAPKKIVVSKEAIAAKKKSFS